MEIILAIISLFWSILGMILFFKIWKMTNNVKEIHDWLKEDRLKKQRSSGGNPPSPVLRSETEELPEENSVISNLKKGEKVTIADYGICTFEGVWSGKYAFYPENKTELPSSPYLINDVEPYLLIPKYMIQKRGATTDFEIKQ